MFEVVKKIDHRTALIVGAVFTIVCIFTGVSTFNSYFSLTPIVATAKKLSRGQIVQFNDLTFVSVPKNRVPAGAYLKKELCADLAAVGLIPAGEVLTKDLLSPVSEAGAASELAKDYPGKVAYAVPLNINTTVGGKVEPGDRVELSAFIKNGNSSSVQVISKSAVVFYISQGQSSTANNSAVVFALTPAENEQAKNCESAGANFKAVLLPVER